MGAQFLSRFVFMLLSKFDHDLAKSLEWHYNKAHDGKEPMGEAGGTVKNIRGVGQCCKFTKTIDIINLFTNIRSVSEITKSS